MCSTLTWWGQCCLNKVKPKPRSLFILDYWSIWWCPSSIFCEDEDVAENVWSQIISQIFSRKFSGGGAVTSRGWWELLLYTPWVSRLPLTTWRFLWVKVSENPKDVRLKLTPVSQSLTSAPEFTSAVISAGLAPLDFCNLSVVPPTPRRGCVRDSVGFTAVLMTYQHRSSQSRRFHRERCCSILKRPDFVKKTWKKSASLTSSSFV